MSAETLQTVEDAIRAHVADVAPGEIVTDHRVRHLRAVRRRIRGRYGTLQPDSPTLRARTRQHHREHDRRRRPRPSVDQRPGR